MLLREGIEWLAALAEISAFARLEPILPCSRPKGRCPQKVSLFKE